MSNISNISNIFIYLAKENIYLFIYLFQKVQIIFRYISTQGCFVASSSSSSSLVVVDVHSRW